MTDDGHLRGFIRALGDYRGDNLLDVGLCEWCATLPPTSDPRRFLRDVVDVAVFIGGGTPAMISTLADLAEFPSETLEEAAARRLDLEERFAARRH